MIFIILCLDVAVDFIAWWYLLNYALASSLFFSLYVSLFCFSMMLIITRKHAKMVPGGLMEQKYQYPLCKGACTA